MPNTLTKSKRSHLQRNIINDNTCYYCQQATYVFKPLPGSQYRSWKLALPETHACTTGLKSVKTSATDVRIFSLFTNALSNYTC
jgi:hypothetical protein